MDTPRKSAPPSLEELLALPAFYSPEIVGDEVFFVSSLSGKLSLHCTPLQGGPIRSLLPGERSLPNPALMYGTRVFRVLPALGKILVMIDQDGDELFQPHWVAIQGGEPEALFPAGKLGDRLYLAQLDAGAGIAYFRAELREKVEREILRVDLRSLSVENLGGGAETGLGVAHNREHSELVLQDQFSYGDEVLYRWDHTNRSRRPLVAELPSLRQPSKAGAGFDQPILYGSDGWILCRSTWFKDNYSPCLIGLTSGEIRELPVNGTDHPGFGEFESIASADGKFLLVYNIDGCSHAYLARLRPDLSAFEVERKLCGSGLLSNGVLQGTSFRPRGESGWTLVLSFSSASAPSRLYLLDSDKQEPRVIASEPMPVDSRLLAPGESIRFASFDGQEITARLYLPPPALGFSGPRPLLVYIHGGPQGQERPDFTWFSMPVIQYLVGTGFAVFTPNARGSTGYGIRFMRHVHRDWGGKDVLDHVEGVKVLEQDPRIDSSRRGVFGRSYGGFMSMCLLTRYPEIFQAGANLFGMTSLLDLYDQVPESWKPYLRLNVGDPEIEADRVKMTECSPATHLGRLQSSVLYVQGKNDPRARSHWGDNYVEQLRRLGKTVEQLVFNDEGHGINQASNKRICFERIGEFFLKHLA